MLRAIAGVIAGVAMWKIAVPLELHILPAMSNLLYWILGSETRLHRAESHIQIITPRAIAADGGTVRLELLTFNAIILVVLLAVTIRPGVGREVKRFIRAFALLVFVHLLGVIATANATLLVTLQRQNKEFSASEWNIWLALSQGYQIILGSALVFAIWWGLSSQHPLKDGVRRNV